MSEHTGTLVPPPESLRVPPVANPDVERIINPGAAFGVEPRGSGFESAFRFVLGQELWPGEPRRHPGRAIQQLGEGDVGVDPVAQREFERLHPDVSRRLLETMGQGWAEHGEVQRRERPPSEGLPPRRIAEMRQGDYIGSIYADVWNRSGADRLPRPLALAHFDAAVHMGPGTAKQILRESGGDVDRYIEIREERLRRLMTGPRSKLPTGGYDEIPAEQTGWLSQRIPAVRAEVDRLRGIGTVARRREQD